MRRVEEGKHLEWWMWSRRAAKDGIMISIMWSGCRGIECDLLLGRGERWSIGDGVSVVEVVWWVGGVGGIVISWGRRWVVRRGVVGFGVVKGWVIIMLWGWRRGVSVVGVSGVEVMVDGLMVSPVVLGPPC